MREELRTIEVRSGVVRISDERQRQILQEGWTPDHDTEHGPGDLAAAAQCYAEVATIQLRDPSSSDLRELLAGPSPIWPWEPSWWKPSDDPIRNLEKAGALTAAEIDRHQRVAR